MESLTKRMAELGLTLPPVAKALASYVPAVIMGDLCFTSGQLPLVSGALVHTGLVGTEVDLASAMEAARIAALNALSAAAEAAGGLDAIAGVIKITGFVQSSPSFHQEPQVLNGASDMLEAIFGASGRHARSAVGVSSLPLNAPVEVECIFRLAESRHG